MIWYLDEAKLWQLSVEKHISLTVNWFALTQLRSASAANQAYYCKKRLIILNQNANSKREKISNWKTYHSWIDKSHLWDCDQWPYLLLPQTCEDWKRNKENVRQIVMRFICIKCRYIINQTLCVESFFFFFHLQVLNYLLCQISRRSKRRFRSWRGSSRLYKKNR